MRLFRHITFRPHELPAFGETCESAIGLLRDLGEPDAPIGFYFSDKDGVGKRASGRALKKMPVLASFALDKAQTFSNLDAWRSGAPSTSVPKPSLSQQMLLEIAHGIPRTFPFDLTMVLFDQVPWGCCLSGQPPLYETSLRDPHLELASLEGLLAHGYYSSWIIGRNDWWHPKRRQALMARIEMDVPPSDQTTPPDLPERVRRLIERLGPVQREELIAKPDAGVQEDQLQALLAKDSAEAEAELKELALPYPGLLDPAARPVDSLPTGDNVPPKKSLQGAMKPLGYQWVSNMGMPGGYFLRKRTAQNHLIELVFDMGTWYQQCSATLSIRGPFSTFVHIDICPIGGRAGEVISTGNSSKWQRMCQNFAVIVQHLEHKLLPRIAQIAEPAPKWFSY